MQIIKKIDGRPYTCPPRLYVRGLTTGLAGERKGKGGKSYTEPINGGGKARLMVKQTRAKIAFFVCFFSVANVTNF